MVVVEIEGHEDALDPVLTKYMKSKGYEKTSGFADFAFEKGRRRLFYAPEDFRDKFFMAVLIITFIWGFAIVYEDYHDLLVALIASVIVAPICAWLFKFKFASESKWLIERICDFTMGSNERIYARISSFKDNRIELIIHTPEKKLENDVEGLAAYLKSVKLPNKK